MSCFCILLYIIINLINMAAIGKNFNPKFSNCIHMIIDLGSRKAVMGMLISHPSVRLGQSVEVINNAEH